MRLQKKFEFHHSWKCRKGLATAVVVPVISSNICKGAWSYSTQRYFNFFPGNFFKKVFKGWRRKRSSPSKFIPEPANGQFIPLKRSRSHFSRGLRRKRDLERALNQDFVVHLRRRRFVTKVICEGLVGGGCSGTSDQKRVSPRFTSKIQVDAVRFSHLIDSSKVVGSEASFSPLFTGKIQVDALRFSHLIDSSKVVGLNPVLSPTGEIGRTGHYGNTLFCRAVTSILNQWLLHIMPNSRQF